MLIDYKKVSDTRKLTMILHTYKSTLILQALSVKDMCCSDIMMHIRKTTGLQYDAPNLLVCITRLVNCNVVKKYRKNGKVYHTIITETIKDYLHDK